MKMCKECYKPDSVPDNAGTVCVDCHPKVRARRQPFDKTFADIDQVLAENAEIMERCVG